MGLRTQILHPILTAETHNFPTYVCRIISRYMFIHIHIFLNIQGYSFILVSCFVIPFLCLFYFFFFSLFYLLSFSLFYLLSFSLSFLIFFSLTFFIFFSLSFYFFSSNFLLLLHHLFLLLSVLRGVAPFSGAETGTGGRLRDVMATGRGAHSCAGVRESFLGIFINLIRYTYSVLFSVFSSDNRYLLKYHNCYFCSICDHHHSHSISIITVMKSLSFILILTVKTATICFRSVPTVWAISICPRIPCHGRPWVKSMPQI